MQRGWLFILMLTVVVAAMPSIATAQAPLNQGPSGLTTLQADSTKRIDTLESRMRSLETRFRNQGGGSVLFLFGAFCALWAQNNKRSPWGWFFAGVFLNVFAVLVLLSENRRIQRGDPAADKKRLLILTGILVVLILIFGMLAIFQRH